MNRRESMNRRASLKQLPLVCLLAYVQSLVVVGVL